MRPFPPQPQSEPQRPPRAALVVALVAWVLVGAAPSSPADLAAGRPASASSIENDEHDASHGNDGKPDTCWRADDEPEGGPDWWQVDLGKPSTSPGARSPGRTTA
jgi:hypothetical protein